MPHGFIEVFNNILYENEFQNPQNFLQTISLFPEQSTFVLGCVVVVDVVFRAGSLLILSYECKQQSADILVPKKWQTDSHFGIRSLGSRR
jgi:hypothetical protein